MSTLLEVANETRNQLLFTTPDINAVEYARAFRLGRTRGIDLDSLMVDLLLEAASKPADDLPRAGNAAPIPLGYRPRFPYECALTLTHSEFVKVHKFADDRGAASIDELALDVLRHWLQAMTGCPACGGPEAA